MGIKNYLEKENLISYARKKHLEKSNTLLWRNFLSLNPYYLGQNLIIIRQEIFETLKIRFLLHNNHLNLCMQVEISQKLLFSQKPGIKWSLLYITIAIVAQKCTVIDTKIDITTFFYVFDFSYNYYYILLVCININMWWF